ncbi:response regulator transcription factor [Slackia heliotrinireducens]|uniref:response regulator transcription factor n=1 Tax=Slackia heliotrinireducens TaxID=84110 RepID=UPI003314C3E9
MRDIYDARILVIEDDPSLRDVICELVAREGWRQVRHAGTVADALRAIATWSPDAMLIDVMLPDGNGFDLLRTVRQTSQAPAIIVSARDEDEARLRGLGLGADDYITKPFLPRELVLRLAAVLKRTYGAAAEPHLVALGDCTVDLASGEVTRADGSGETLTAKEHALLSRLVRSRGSIVTSDDLAQAVWGTSFGYANALMVHVRRLREKIEDDPSDPQWILTVRGLGYRLAKDGSR